MIGQPMQSANIRAMGTTAKEQTTAKQRFHVDAIIDSSGGDTIHNFLLTFQLGFDAPPQDTFRMPSVASWLIRGTRPTVETVTPRAEMPRPSGDGSVNRRTAPITAL